tara:strand:- start:556 stop:774 length:219 start_codon:yes stop_codon:yes gene_type:complete
MDPWGYSRQYPSGWETLMASLLDHNFPMVPEEYDPGTFARIMRDLEMALTKFDFPAVMSGEDDTKGLSWFMD